MRAKSEQKCPGCGGSLHRDIRTREIKYKGDATVFDQPGWYCDTDGCKDGILDPDDIRHWDLAMSALKARVEAVLTPDEVRQIRKRLGLSQHEAGKLLGGGIRAFYRYESGQIMVSQSMNNLLRLLNSHPELLDELRR